MKYDFVILGATGLQGRIVSRDLIEKGYSVLLCDKTKISANKIHEKVKNAPFVKLDLRDKKKTFEVLKNCDADIVINCAEDDFIISVLEICLELGKHCVDLGSYFEMVEKQLAMDKLFKEKNIISVTGCGSVPGIGNVMLKHAAKKLDEIETIDVGFSWDSNIKKFVIPFSMEGIFWEFTKPAHVLEEGKFIEINPLESITTRNFRNLGSQKIMCVNHSEPFTFYHYFKDKGVKNIRFYAGFPQHSFDKIVSLIELGLHSYEPVEVDDLPIRPIDTTIESLRKLPIPEGYEETEVLWVDVIGTLSGEKKSIKMECSAKTILGWEDAGCNIDTGFTAVIIAEMIKKKIITQPGVFSPEAIVPEKKFFRELAKNGLVVLENGRAVKELFEEVEIKV